jgi:hypothetical protein
MHSGVSWHHCATVDVCVSKCANASALKFVQHVTLYFAQSCVRFCFCFCQVFWYQLLRVQV